MKILLYNPNTSESITKTLFDTAKLVVSEGTSLIPMTAEKASLIFPLNQKLLLLEQPCLETIAKYNSQYDACNHSCFWRSRAYSCA
jgi:Asp/Glu/hydantoin racemase